MRPGEEGGSRDCRDGGYQGEVCTPFLSQICRGLLPMLYRMDRNPDWKVFLNMAGSAAGPTLLAGGGRGLSGLLLYVAN
eukprot:COSAG01_NODE_9766_length_2347_cov_31.477333_3_plen_79_part_00